jgi:hypothetical protein
MKIAVNPSTDPERDFEVDPLGLKVIHFSEICIGDVIKVTHRAEWGWDYRHVHEVHRHPTDPDKSYATGFGYRVGTGIGGCVICADRTDFTLERVEPNTAFRLLEYYQRNWAHPEIPRELHPRTINV